MDSETRPTMAPTNDMGGNAGKKPLPQDDSVTCPCCGQGTTKAAMHQYVDSLPSTQTPEMHDLSMHGGGMDDSAPPMPDERSMVGKYA